MACELLIRLQDGRPGVGRHAGSIVSVRQVPHAGWGLMERPPKYGLIQIMDRDASSPEILALIDTPNQIKLKYLVQKVRDKIDQGLAPQMSWSVFAMKLAR